MIYPYILDSHHSLLVVSSRGRTSSCRSQLALQHSWPAATSKGRRTDNGHIAVEAQISWDNYSKQPHMVASWDSIGAQLYRWTMTWVKNDMLCLDPVQSSSVLSVFSLSLLADIQRPTYWYLNENKSPIECVVTMYNTLVVWFCPVWIIVIWFVLQHQKNIT